MSTPATNESARSRRARSAALAILGLVAVLVCLTLANALAARYTGRLDVTATGDHQLAPRTTATLGALRGPYTVVLAGDFSRLDRAQLERARDVLAQMQRTSANIQPQFLDTSASTGQQQFVQLLTDLAARDREILDLQTRSIRAAADRGITTAEYLETGLAPAILKIRDGLPLDGASLKLRENLDARSAACRLSAADLRAAAKAIEEPLGSSIAGIQIPQTDIAAQQIRAILTSVGEQVSTLVRDLKTIAAAEALPATARGPAEGMIEPSEKARDAALTAADTLSRITRPDVLRIAKALEAGDACIVVGPTGTGLMAIEFSQLFPPALRAESAADAGQRTEQLVSTAISALNTPVRPIVVFMHGELGTGLVAQPGIVSRVSQRLALRGIDVAEWAVLSQEQPPALTSLNPDGKRPVIYAAIPPDSSASKPKPTDPSGAERAAKFGAALTLVADRGAPILLSLYPSVLPTYGDKDPTTAVLDRFGLVADSGRPLMKDRLTPQGRTVETDQGLRAVSGEHPILKAIHGLPTLFLWPIALAPAPDQGGAARPPAALTPLFEVPAQTQSWAESQWLNFWRLPRSERTVVPNLPEYNEGRDARYSPMITAYAAELPAAGGRDRQRLVAIGTNRWFMDPVTTPVVNIDGRTLLANPGNIELLEASVYWLAGQDDLIAQSPEARAVALLQSLSPGTEQGLRIAFVAGLPLLVLIAGVAYRLARG
ncbi:MAG TPA: hypothetical protein VK176_07595 [Phycisphaerales bacterium]|nr:hypothetical protein [Phycisphaerales bacterium]